MWLQLAAYGTLIGAFVIIVPLTVNECLRDASKKFVHFNSGVKKSLDEYFERVNLQLQSRGIQWSVNEGHYWLECRIIRDGDPMRDQNVFTEEKFLAA